MSKQPLFSVADKIYLMAHGVGMNFLYNTLPAAACAAASVALAQYASTVDLSTLETFGVGAATGASMAGLCGILLNTNENSLVFRSIQSRVTRMKDDRLAKREQVKEA